MTKRRNFSMQLRIAIVNRASDEHWNIHCEKCGAFCKSKLEYQIDHVIPEKQRPKEDLKKPLVAADGQLLCLACHRLKTAKDLAHIALAKRQEAYHKGLKDERKRRIRTREKAPKEPYEPCPGEPRIAREFGS